MPLDGYRVSHYYADNIRKHSDMHGDRIDAHRCNTVSISSRLAGDTIGNALPSPVWGKRTVCRVTLRFQKIFIFKYDRYATEVGTRLAF